jgi:hypothetical protein
MWSGFVVKDILAFEVFLKKVFLRYKSQVYRINRYALLPPRQAFCRWLGDRAKISNSR